MIAAWIFLIAVIATVKIPVTHFLSSDQEASNILNFITFHRFALVIVIVLGAIVAISLVTLIKAIVSLVTAIVLRYAVGRVKFVGSTGEFA